MGFLMLRLHHDLSLLHQVNEALAREGMAPLTESPGLRTLEFGANKDGYWTMTKMLKQLKEYVIAEEVMMQNVQFCHNFDWSSGHAALPPGALHAASMNMSWGGKQPKMRSTKIQAEKGFLGSNGFELCRKDPRPSDSRLQVGDLQHMVFQEGDPPPWYDPHAEGYTGQPKGLKQILWERGLWSDSLTLPTARLAMAECLDFTCEETALEQLAHQRGHLLRMTPKGHPELAGVGIEYSWGKAKYNFRKINDCDPKNFHNLVLQSLSDNVIDRARARKFARRARDYMRAYATGVSKHVDIEAQRKTYKTHRCAMDFDELFIRQA